MLLESAYHYALVNKEHGDGEGLNQVLIYHFKSKKSKLTYIVRVEHFDYDVYAVKFYLKNHSLSPDKYRLMTNTNEPRRVINTCINIMIDIWQHNGLASFGFVGANGMNEASLGNTKRYRVYSRIVATYFSSKHYLHKEDVYKSTYLLVNRKKLECKSDLMECIERMFANRYDYFG